MKAYTCAVSASLALLLAACAAPAPQNEAGHRHPPARHHHHGEPGREGETYDPSLNEQQAPRQEQGRRSRGAERFACESGLSVTVRPQGTDRLVLRLDDKTAVLQRAVSASGVRYVSNRGLFGSGAEWHEKGGEAAFSFKDPYGNSVDTVCRRQ